MIQLLPAEGDADHVGNGRDHRVTIGRWRPEAMPPRVARVARIWSDLKHVRNFDTIIERNCFDLTTDLWPDIDRVLDEWSTLSSGWDGRAAPAPSEAAIAVLRRVARLARSAGLSEPRPSIASDGDMGLHWVEGGRTATLVITCEGEMIGYCPVTGQKGMTVTQPMLDYPVLGGFFSAVRRLT